MLDINYLEKVATEKYEDFLQKVAADDGIIAKTINDMANITTEKELGNWKGGVRNIAENIARSALPALAVTGTAKALGVKPLKALSWGSFAAIPGAAYSRWQDVNTVFPNASTGRKLVYGFSPLPNSIKTIRGVGLPYIAGAKKYPQYME